MAKKKSATEEVVAKYSEHVTASGDKIADRPR